MVAVHSWGRLSNQEHRVTMLGDRSQAGTCVKNTAPGLAYGMGCSYGDACLNPQGTLWLTTNLNRFIAFDGKSGRLRCEAGVLLRDIQQLMVPRGWMLPVSPGTQLITVGGAISNDVHGKNHHVEGSFGDHIIKLSLVRTDGETIHCGPEERSEWFAATVGGVGLTGVITTAELQLRPVAGPWIHTETIPYRQLSEFIELADRSEAQWEYTVAWIDCLAKNKARGLFTRGSHVHEKECANEKPRALTPIRSFNFPVMPPFSMVNRLSLRLFNMGYYHLKKLKSGEKISHYEPFFYPLDKIHNWSRMYGRKGFFQYQSVVPRDSGYDVTRAMLKAISQSHEGSFLAILKTFGNRQSLGMLGFPAPGITLALDFPNHGARTEKLFKRLDAIVREAKGRLYLAKDARMPRAMFETGYPKFHDFMLYRDPGISSSLSRRLMGS